MSRSEQADLFKVQADSPRTISDMDAYIALLAAERCWAMADRSNDDLLKRCWQADGDAAWETVKKWEAQ